VMLLLLEETVVPRLLLAAASRCETVLVGSLLSSRAPDKYIRPIITFVIFASGLKYVGMGTTALGWTLCAVLLAGGACWLWLNSRKTKAEPSPELEVEVLRQLAGHRV